jgi:hypothetical protein
MFVTLPTARITRFTILAIAGAAALSVAACGTSNNTKPSTAASSASSAPASPTSSSPAASAKGKEWVNGVIASVASSAVQVTQDAGTATVDFTPSTKLAEVTHAQLSDITAGSCVKARPASDSAPASSGTITADSVTVSQAVDGKCPQPKASAGSSTTTAPTPAPSGAAAAPRVRGTVASVAGNTITLTATDANGNSSQTNVAVTDTTKYSKKAPADAQALTQGKCISAHGTKESGGGNLQATSITVKQADNGICPKPAGKQQSH